MTTDTAEQTATSSEKAPARIPWRRPRRDNGKRYAHRSAGWRLGYQRCCGHPARSGHGAQCPRGGQS